MLNWITRLVLSVIIITFTSCGYVARQIITQKSCKECEILDQYNNLEQRAKATA